MLESLDKFSNISGYSKAFTMRWRSLDQKIAENKVKRTIAAAHSESSQISKTELVAKIVNSWKVLTNFSKSSTLNAWMGSEYAFKLL